MQMQTRGPLLHGMELSHDSDSLQAVLVPQSWPFPRPSPSARES